MNATARHLPGWLADVREAMRNIESDVGEAANRIMALAPHWQQDNPAAWEHLRRIHAMRNVLAHGYFRIDAGVVWATVKQDLPTLHLLLDSLRQDGPEA
jgi:uncharacterized protein with HEPN domain